MTVSSLFMNEKHLILAVLAFQSKLISLAQLTEAYEVWVADKSASLTEILQHRDWVNGPSLAALELQFREHLSKFQDESAGSTNGMESLAFDFDEVPSALRETGNNQALGTLPRSAPELLESISMRQGHSSSSSDRYTWVSEVGKGGLGQVWLARDNDLVREVALKQIKAESESAEAVRRLIKEAQITGQLQHPNIVPVYEVHRGERPFYTMKLVRGKTLSETIQQHHEQRRAGHEDPLSMPRLMSIFINICDALAYAHSRGIMHRDLKPQNIVLGDFGEAIVLDWGLARPLHCEHDDEDCDHQHMTPVTLTDDARTDATQTGAALGTPAYMSPEQAVGRVDLMDARTDVYGLGAILFEILTGHPPHRMAGNSDPHASHAQPAPVTPSLNHTLPVNSLFALLIQISTGPSPHIRDLYPSLPIELDTICARAMAKEREDRFQTAQDFKEALLDYHIHEKSFELAAAASVELTAAKSSQDYTKFNRALFGFEEALRQWPENARAAEGERETRIAFAKTAYARGDFEFAESMLDVRVPEHKTLLAIVRKAAAERASRYNRIKFLRRFSLATSLSVAIVASSAAVWVNNERLRAVLAREDAKVAQIHEARQRKVAEQERLIAEQQSQVALQERQNAEKQTRMAIKERQIADAQTKVALLERQKAAEQLERADRTAQEARWGRYISSLRLAAMQLDGGAIAFCNQTLQASRPHGTESDLRGWEWNYLWNQTHSDLRTLEGHTGPVQCACFSPTGKQIASASWDGTIRLWDALTGEPLRTLEGHAGWVRSVNFSRDGLRIVSSSDDKTLKIWDAETGHELRTLTGHAASIHSAAFSPDGSRIASASNDQLVKLWNATTGDEQLTLTGHKASVLSVAFSPDGLQIVSSSDDQTAKIWDAQTGKIIREFVAHTAPIQSANFSPDGQRIVSGSRDGLVIAWNARTADVEQVFEGHTAWVRSVVFTPDGNRIVSASDDKTIKVWDLHTGKEKFTLLGHTDGVACAQISADNKRIVSASDDKSLKIWDAQTGQAGLILRGHQDAVQSVAFSPNSRHVASGSKDKTVKVWDIQAGEMTMTLTGHTGWVRSIAFSPDGRLLASAGGERERPGELKLWNAQTGELIQTYAGHTDTIHCVRFDREGKRLLTGSADQTLKFWDVATGKLIRTSRGHTAAVTCVSFGPFGKRFVSGSVDKTVKVWDIETGAETHTLQGHSEMVRAVSFGPDGQHVVSGAGVGGRPGELKIWDILAGHETFSLQGHQDAVESVNFSTDGKRILSASQEGRLKIWDALSGQELLAFRGPADGITSSTFCRDDRHILTGNQNGTLQIWDGGPENEAAARAVEREARTAIFLLQPKFPDREQLKTALHADPTLTPAALKLAVEWVTALQQ